QFSRQLALLESLRHSHADQLRLAHLRQLDRVAKMIAMGMGDENVGRMIVGEILKFGRRRGILSQEQVEYNLRPARRDDLESQMPQPGNLDVLLLTRRLRQSAAH